MATEDVSSVAREDMPSVATEGVSSVVTERKSHLNQEKYYVATRHMYSIQFTTTTCVEYDRTCEHHTLRKIITCCTTNITLVYPSLFVRVVIAQVRISVSLQFEQIFHEGNPQICNE